MRDHALAEAIDLGGDWALTDDTGAHIGNIALPGGGITALLYRWSDGAGGSGVEHSAPRPYKTHNLRRPDILAEVEPVEGDWRITLTPEALALFVSVETETGRLSDNCVALIPKSPRTLHLRSDEDVPKLALRDLYGATYN